MQPKLPPGNNPLLSHTLLNMGKNSGLTFIVGACVIMALAMPSIRTVKKGTVMPSMGTNQPLLLAAFPPELAGLDRNPPSGWQVRCIGVGGVTAAVTTAGLISYSRPTHVIFVGTCGAYDQRVSVGDLVEAAEALSISLEEMSGQAYRPAIERVRWPATLVLPEPLGLPVHTVAVPMVITKTVEGANLLGRHAAVENLELTGVFAACDAAGVPCGAFLAVADHVGPNAHLEWKANHARVSQELINALMSKKVFAQL
jgi:purine-nucleoside phosphorylase